MQRQSYQSAIDWLFQQFPSYQNIGAGAYKPNLDNIHALISELSIPLTKVPYVHVAGTNGKGSTCSILASTLTEAGYKVGLFTSPHINDFRERIRINGVLIQEEAVIDFVTHIQDASSTVTPSFFEISLAMALDHFNRERCDIAIIETGLGGRLDATNIISPILSVITNISLEHQIFLGDTRAQIAAEKAGIIKTTIPVVIGQMDEEIGPVFSQVCENLRSTLYSATSNHPNYLERNKVIVQKCLEVLKNIGFPTKEEHFDLGIQHVKSNAGLRGRLQVINHQPLVIADAAHNEDGIRSMFRAIGTMYPKSDLRIVYGSSADKDLDQIGKLFPSKADYYLTQFKNPRSFSEKQLYEFSSNFGLNARFYSSPKLALQAAQDSANESTVIIVFGSFFLLEEIF